jgi:hypothetical protein
MSVRRGIGGAVLAFLLAGAGAAAADEAISFSTTGSFPQLSVEHGRSVAAIVHIADGALSPARVEVPENGRVAWRSFSSEGLRISFPAEVARSMRCDSVVNFRRVDDRLVSGRLGPGDTAHFCALAPGIYPYRVRRDDLSTRRGPISGRLRGTLVVTGNDVAALER